MNKARISLVISAILILALFCVIAFVVPFVREDSFWIGFGFTAFAVLLVLGTSLYAFRSDSARSRFYGMPLPLMLWSYLIIQVVLGFIFMAAYMIPVWISLLICLILAVVYLLGLVAVAPAAAHAENFDRKVAAKTDFIKTLASAVKLMELRVADPALAREIHALQEDIRYSSPMSSPSLALLESRIQGKVEELSGLVDSDPAAASALCRELRLLVAERTEKCRV